MQKKLVIFLALFLCLAGASPVLAAEKNLTLADSIEIALHNNLNLELAQKNVDIAIAQLGQTKAGKKGSLDFSSSYLKLQDLPDKENYKTAIDLKYPLYTGGVLEAGIKAKELGVESANYNAESAKQGVAYGVKQTYYTVLRTQHLVDVAQEYLDGMESHLKVAQAMYKTGMVPKFDVLRAEVAVLDARQKLIKAKNGVELSKVAFNNVLNRDLNTAVSLVDSQTIDPKYEKVSLEQLIVKAQKQRPELKSWQKTARMFEEGIKAAKGSNKPNLAVIGQYKWDGEKFMDKNSSYIGLATQFNLWDGGNVKKMIKEAEERLAQAQTQVEKNKKDIAYEVRQAYLNLQEAKEGLATAKKTVEQAKEGLKIAQVRYKSGMGTSVERIDAQTALTQAETNYTQAFYDYNLAKAELEKALGE